jgi:periplasmic protein TonB
VAKDINLNSEEWCDIVFEGKNHNYGAYQMRQTSPKRHARAFIAGFLIIAFMTYLPTLIEVVKSLTPHEKMTQVTTLSNLKVEDQVKEENIQHQTEAPPPPALKTTVKFSEPVIVNDAEVKESEELKSQEDLATTKATISVADVKGSDDEHGIDIQDLQKHAVAVEDKPLMAAEQMPAFPGGDDELTKFIQDHLRYPASAAEMGIEGRVTVRFVVSRTGEVTNVEVVRGLDVACDREALRVVKLLPKWIPGKQSGRNVPVYFTLPIYYRLQR